MENDTTRNRIMMAAGPIFAKKGFRSATVREICESAEVNVASINYYFGDKQRLYHETVILAREMRAQQFPDPLQSMEMEPEQRLFQFVSMLLNRLVALQTEPWQVRLLMREILQPTETCKTLVEEYFRPFFVALSKTVDDLVAESGNEPLEEHQRIQIGFSIIGQCLYYRLAADVTSMFIKDDDVAGHFDVPSLAEHITQFSLAAIRQLNKTGTLSSKYGK